MSILLFIFFFHRSFLITMKRFLLFVAIVGCVYGGPLSTTDSRQYVVKSNPDVEKRFIETCKLTLLTYFTLK